MTRKLILVALVQAALVLAAVFGQLSSALTGQQVRLQAAPADPIEPFRGAYVAVRYPTIDGLRTSGPQHRVFVVLTKSGKVWEAAKATTTRPNGGVYLTCTADDGGVDCGADSLFLPEAKAAGFEVTKTTVATLKVDRWGHAYLVGLD